MRKFFPIAAVVVSIAVAVGGIMLDVWWVTAAGGVAVLVTGLRWALFGSPPRTFRNMDDHSTINASDFARNGGDGGGD